MGGGGACSLLATGTVLSQLPGQLAPAPESRAEHFPARLAAAATAIGHMRSEEGEKGSSLWGHRFFREGPWIVTTSRDRIGPFGPGGGGSQRQGHHLPFKTPQVSFADQATGL